MMIRCLLAGLLLGFLKLPMVFVELPALAGPPAPVAAPELEREVRRLAGAAGGPLWPGFDPLEVPLAVFDGEGTWLFRHPSPPAGFAPAAGDDAFVSPGRHAAMTANSSADIGGASTATVLLDKPGSRSSTSLAAVAIHEAFHVYQRARHPDWSGNEGDLFTYPVENVEILSRRRLESEALRRALGSSDRDSAASWSRAALSYRTARYARMDTAFAVYERKTELNEGIATHVELKALGLQEIPFPEEEFEPDAVRLRAYTTGPALATLLERFAPGWEEAFERGGEASLDEALSKALGFGREATFEEEQIRACSARAAEDVAALEARRSRIVQEFETRPGWRLVIEGASGAPLWPQGFDPLNVQPAGAGRVLHTRYVKLGNDQGTVEVLDRNALTVPAGGHPLFNGISRLLVTGLDPPQVDQDSGKVTIAASGVNASFSNASVNLGDNEIVVRLR